MLRSPSRIRFASLLVWLVVLVTPAVASSDRWTVRGRVLTHAGKPVAGARVACDAGLGFGFPPLAAPIGWRLLVREGEIAPGLRGFEQTTVRTDAEGHFSLENLDEPTFGLLGIHAAGYPFHEQIISSQDANLESRTIDVGDVRLETGGALLGRVTGPESSQATIAIQPLPPITIGGEAPPPRRPGETRWKPVDGQGRFELRGLRPGGYVVAAFGPTSRVTTREVVIAATEEAPTEVALTLVPGEPLSCQVLSLADRAPVPDVQLTLWPIPDGSPSTVSVLDSVRTDELGKASFVGLGPRRYRVVAIPADRVESAGPVPAFSIAAEARAGEELELIMSLGRDLIIEVRDPEGELVPTIETARLTPVRSAIAQQAYQARHGTPGGFAFRSDGSRLRAHHVRPGLYLLTLHARGFSPASLELELNDGFEVPRFAALDESGHDFAARFEEGTPVLELRLPRALGLMEGFVVDAKGKRVDGATVRATEYHRDLKIHAIQETATDDQGRFLVTGLFDQGAHLRIDVEADGFLPSYGVWTRFRDQTPPAIVLTAEARLYGQLVDSRGRPIPWGRVELLDGDPKPFHNPQLSRQVTDRDGRFRFDLLAAGPYRLKAEETEIPVDLEAGERREIRLERR